MEGSRQGQRKGGKAPPKIDAVLTKLYPHEKDRNTLIERSVSKILGQICLFFCDNG